MMGQRGRGTEYEYLIAGAAQTARVDGCPKRSRGGIVELPWPNSLMTRAGVQGLAVKSPACGGLWKPLRRRHWPLDWPMQPHQAPPDGPGWDPPPGDIWPPRYRAGTQTRSQTPAVAGGPHLRLSDPQSRLPNELLTCICSKCLPVRPAADGESATLQNARLVSHMPMACCRHLSCQYEAQSKVGTNSERIRA